MENVKQWYQSRTVWGALVAVAASLAQMGGVDFDPAMQGNIVGNLVALSGAVGGLFAVYGRMKANMKLA